MTSHRAEAPSLAALVADVVTDVRNQMSDVEIGKAVQALTIGSDSYKALLTVLGRPVRLENRGPDARMGRFGGGWEFQVGVQTGRNGTKGTIIINLGRGSIRIDPKKEA